MPGHGQPHLGDTQGLGDQKDHAESKCWEARMPKNQSEEFSQRSRVSDRAQSQKANQVSLPVDQAKCKVKEMKGQAEHSPQVSQVRYLRDQSDLLEA